MNRYPAIDPGVMLNMWNAYFEVAFTEGVSCQNHTAPLGPGCAVGVAFTRKYLCCHIRAGRGGHFPAVAKCQGAGHHYKNRFVLMLVWQTSKVKVLYKKEKPVYLLSHLSVGHSSHWSQNLHRGHRLGSANKMVTNSSTLKFYSSLELIIYESVNIGC